MPQAQEVKTATVKVEGTLQHPHDNKRIFGAAGELFTTFLEQKGCFGAFTLRALDAYKGSSQLGGRIRIQSRDAGRNIIKVVIQPSTKTDTCWLYALTVPKDFEIEALFALLSSKDDGAVVESRTPFTEAELSVQPEVMQFTGGAELTEQPVAPEVAPEPEPCKVLSPTAFMADLTLVAIALTDVFPTKDAVPTTHDLVELLMETMTWSGDCARQALQILVNTKHLEKRMIGGEERVLLVGDKLKSEFLQLGFHHPKAAPVATVVVTDGASKEAPAPAPSAPTPASDNVRQLRPVASSAPKPKPEPAPAKAPEPGIGSRLSDLETLASEFTLARQTYMTLSVTRMKLREHQARLDEEVAKNKKRLARNDERLEKALAIITSEAHSSAIGKIAQIQAIIQG